MKTQIKDLMTEIPRTIGVDSSIEKAKELMHELKCHHLPVLDAGKLVGILSATDLKYSSSPQQKVEELMTSEPVVVESNRDFFSVARLMQKENIGSVIISASTDAPWGIFTAYDAIHYLMDTYEKEQRPFA